MTLKRWGIGCTNAHAKRLKGEKNTLYNDNFNAYLLYKNKAKSAVKQAKSAVKQTKFRNKEKCAELLCNNLSSV